MLHPSLIGARACVFDAGGTLIHPDWQRLAALALEVSGRTFGADEMRRAFGEMLKRVGAETPSGSVIDQTGRHWTFRAMYGGLGLDTEACESIVCGIDRAHAERHIWCGPDAEAPRVLEELGREGLRLAVVSNTEDGLARDALEAAGLASYFELVVDSHLVGYRKPDPAIFRLALERLGVGAGEAAFVGDSYAHDALAARAVGMRAILLDPLGLHAESACTRIESLGDLLRGEV
ncbi:MAG TPA: HAD family hydrolase [Pyrinomonadaceae bacterium]|jgi:HAD superfamily hydrolase (TIGR01509 family)|nr:HAD family hydrolase [Pyrinomonadaceae bacterium]